MMFLETAERRARCCVTLRLKAYTLVKNKSCSPRQKSRLHSRFGILRCVFLSMSSWRKWKKLVIPNRS